MEIEFEYDKKDEIKACVNLDNFIRLPRTAAQIMFKLWHNVGIEMDKEKVTKFVWGRDDKHTRRAFDVHLHYVRNFLSGTEYEIDTSKHGRICLSRK